MLGIHSKNLTGTDLQQFNSRKHHLTHKTDNKSFINEKYGIKWKKAP